MRPIPLTKANDTLDLVDKYVKEINEIGGALCGNYNNFPIPTYETRQTLVLFPNHYGISFVEGGISYGLEAAILKYDELNDDWDVCYDTPITDDVIGYMNEEDIIPLCKRVAEL